MDSMSRDRGLTRAEKDSKPPNLSLVAGVFLVVLAGYVLANPGRIDGDCTPTTAASRVSITRLTSFQKEGNGGAPITS
jgi:hypothetical protein